jgi:hypothetical protein
MNFEDYVPTPEAIALGMMAPTKPGQEPEFTAAGLFAFMANYALAEEDNKDPDNQLRIKNGIFDVLDIAEAAGLDPLSSRAIILGFSYGHSVSDETKEGECLASLCRHIALLVDPSRMIDIISGKKPN